jgi:trehalose synthase
MPVIREIEHHLALQEYAEIPQLTYPVRVLRRDARRLVPSLEGRTVWMLNSTAEGGGVAEMLPAMIHLLRELGVSVQWAVMETDGADFFPLTKRLHNLIHGEGEPNLPSSDCELYETVSRENAEWLRRHLSNRDILVVHDPQPLGTGALLKEELGLRAIWRCHIGLDGQTAATRAAWRFLEPYTMAYDHAIFTAPEYVPSYLADRSTIIHPGVDPLSHKNRDLPLHKQVGVLLDSELLRPYGPVLTPPFENPARRLQADGTFGSAAEPEDIGLLFRPIVLQVSRWDRLKGFAPLLHGFVGLKRDFRADPSIARSDRHGRTIELARLVLAGPDPASIQDDPEADQVLKELSDAYRALEPELQADVVILALPMGSRKENALMVNALQRCATIIVQNSLREGFGLTATEAMWKRIPIMATHACGLRLQIRDGVDGRLVTDPEDVREVASTLNEMLADPEACEAWARNAQLRVQEDFLVFSQLRRLLRVLVGKGQ